MISIALITNNQYRLCIESLQNSIRSPGPTKFAVSGVYDIADIVERVTLLMYKLSSGEKVPSVMGQWKWLVKTDQVQASLAIKCWYLHPGLCYLMNEGSLLFMEGLHSTQKSLAPKTNLEQRRPADQMGRRDIRPKGYIIPILRLYFTPYCII